MINSHKILSIFLFSLSFTICCYFKLLITPTVAQLLVTFFSIAFGFFITSIAILYNSSYIKKLYEYIDKKNKQRGIHILINYFKMSSYCSFISIGSIVFYSLFLKIDSLKEKLTIFTDYDLKNVASSIILGFSCVNILFILLFVNIICSGIQYESRQKDLDK